MNNSEESTNGPKTLDIEPLATRVWSVESSRVIGYFSIVRAMMIWQDRIWCLWSDALTKHDLDGEGKCIVVCKEGSHFHKANGMVALPCDEIQILVATFDNGLLSITKKKDDYVVKQIIDGEFHDVVLGAGKIYCIGRQRSNDPISVYQFPYDGSAFDLKQEQESRHSTAIQALKSSLTCAYLKKSNSLLICDDMESKVYQYFLRQEFQVLTCTWHGEKDSSEDQQLLRPKLCGSDGEAKVILADRDNYMLKILEPGNQEQKWRVVKIKGSFRKPYAVSFSRDKNRLYIAGGYKIGTILFTCKQN